MSRGKLRKPKLTEGNSVTWLDKDFVRRHSIYCPKQEWLSRQYAAHKTALLVILVAAFAAILAYTLIIRTVTPMSVMLFAAYTFVLVDKLLADRRMNRYCKELLGRGGETADARNRLMIKSGNKVLGKFLAYGVPLLYYILIGIYVFAQLSGRIAEDSVLLTTRVSVLPWLVLSMLDRGVTYSPIIFMDIDEGILFGNALFPYDVLRGIVSTDDGTAFDLIHEGETVAKGFILADDLNAIRQMHSLRDKYGDLN